MALLFGLSILVSKFLRSHLIDVVKSFPSGVRMDVFMCTKHAILAHSRWIPYDGIQLTFWEMFGASLLPCYTYRDFLAFPFSRPSVIGNMRYGLLLAMCLHRLSTRLSKFSYRVARICAFGPLLLMASLQLKLPMSASGTMALSALLLPSCGVPCSPPVLPILLGVFSTMQCRPMSTLKAMGYACRLCVPVVLPIHRLKASTTFFWMGTLLPRCGTSSLLLLTQGAGPAGPQILLLFAVGTTSNCWYAESLWVCSSSCDDSTCMGNPKGKVCN